MAKWFRSAIQDAAQETRLHVKAGAYVFREGEAGEDLFIIQDGLVEIVKSVNGGERQLRKLEPGDFFGEMAIIEQLPRTASARAVTDCSLLRIGAATFHDMLSQNPAIAIRMLRKMSHRLREKDLQPDTPVAAAGRDDSAPASRTEKLFHSPSGSEFFFSSGTDTSIGRPDPVTGREPDIDLSAVDPDRSVNHSHARIVRHGDRFLFFAEIGAVDSSINGRRVKPGLAFEIRDGDELQLGNVKTKIVLD